MNENPALAYLEVASGAASLAFRLGTVARGECIDHDAKAIADAALSFQRMASEPESVWPSETGEHDGAFSSYYCLYLLPKHDPKTIGLLSQELASVANEAINPSARIRDLATSLRQTFKEVEHASQISFAACRAARMMNHR